MYTLFQKVKSYGNKIAIHNSVKDISYNELLNESQMLAFHLLSDEKDLNEGRVGFMVDPGSAYVQCQWAIWMAGGVAVPLCITYPLDSLAYVIEDTGTTIILVSEKYSTILKEYALEKSIRFIVLDELVRTIQVPLPIVEENRNAMILYTSGTTSKPKGVVTTHTIIKSQINILVNAWQWTENDCTICVLPLHHVHGIINVLCCAVWSGARLEFMPSFDAKNLFDRFLHGNINVFMAVPTIYFKLITYFKSLPIVQQSQISKVLSTFRLMVSGSAALPVSVLEDWYKISHHVLLERYGMTEIGMAISNPYIGHRKPGSVGMPLSGVEVRIVDEKNNLCKKDNPGEIQVKGDTIFKEYWNKPTETQKSFTSDGWFKTGDIAIIENGYYKILGRDSVDIIKSGGYKISALEIEEILREYPGIYDCSVLGLPDAEWGEKVVTVLVTSAAINIEELKNWIKTKIPSYKMPRGYKEIEALPRNAMGKVVKNELKSLFE